MSHPSDAGQNDPIHVAPPPPANWQPQAYGPPSAGGDQVAQPAYPPPPPYAATPPYGQMQPYHAAAAPFPIAPLYSGEVSGYPTAPATLVTAGGRFAAYLLDALLIVVTLLVGWLIWSFFTWANGQTPGKQILGHVVADADTGQACDWGRMLLREFVVKMLMGYLAGTCTFGIYGIVDSAMVFGDRQQTLHDRMVNTVVQYR